MRAWLVATAGVCALLLAQTLGLVHGVAHVSAGALVTKTQAFHHHAHEAEPEAGGLALLFSSHDDGDVDCRLFDQASHGSLAPAMAALQLPMVPASLVLDSARCEALARWAALFDARGPPLTR